MVVDPGVTTGLAFRVFEKITTSVAFSNDEVLHLIGGFEHIVVEKFVTGGRLSTYGWETIMLVGEIVGYCKALEVSYELVTPQSRYPFMQDAQGAVGGLIERSDVAKHEVDALAHLLAFEFRNAR